MSSKNIISNINVDLHIQVPVWALEKLEMMAAKEKTTRNKIASKLIIDWLGVN